MEIMYQVNSFSTVKRVHGSELLADCFFLSTGCEAIGQLRVDIESFIIKEARWEVLRSPDGSLNGEREVEALKGTEAYFDVGGALRRAVGEDGGGLAMELLAECIRGIIQAETYVHTVRGYPTARAYEAHWNKFYLDSCRYYSNLDRVNQQWFDHVGSYARDRCLFNRVKNCVVYQDPEGNLTATGTFCDSFHELGLYVSLTDKGVITSCTGNFLRAPDRVCFENEGHLASLVGKSIAGIKKKEVAGFTGGPQGCNHLVDLAYDLGKAVAIAISDT